METNNTDATQVPSSPSTPATDTPPMPASTDVPATENPLSSSPSLEMGKPDFSQNSAASSGIPQPQGASTAGGPTPASTPPAHHKNSPMLWVIILLVFSFFCGLFLAAWYFQTQLQKVTPQKTT